MVPSIAVADETGKVTAVKKDLQLFMLKITAKHIKYMLELDSISGTP